MQIVGKVLYAQRSYLQDKDSVRYANTIRTGFAREIRYSAVCTLPEKEADQHAFTYAVHDIVCHTTVL